MAKLTFPSSPSVNDIYNQDGVSYQWDGTKWTANNDTALTLDAILTNGSSTTQTLTTGAITSPTAAKAWAYVASNGTVNRGYNVSSVHDGNSPAVYTVTFTNSMSTTDYVVVGSSRANTSGTDAVSSWFSVVSKTTGGFVYQVRTTNSGTLPGEGKDEEAYFVCYE